jgi:hypothetical protein
MNISKRSYKGIQENISYKFCAEFIYLKNKENARHETKNTESKITDFLM